MADDLDLLKRTKDRLDRLAPEQLAEVEGFLDDLEAGRGVHVLTDEERAVLEPRRERARRGEFAGDDEVRRVFGRLVK
jgi:hypothetical protein